MCGINGFSFCNEKIVNEMNSLIAHRGPDSKGTYVDEHISLGHQRLKIIDLSEKGAQPMSDSDKGLWVVFNGEIYNFKEIKEVLEEEGYKFNSDSDTEIIIQAYKKWGYDCVNHFNGMWAFALYDKNKNKLFLSRDRLGKKPLYYTRKGKDLVFSSGIKPLFLHNIEKKLNKTAVSSYLSYRYVLGEETMFENIFKLLPAHNLIFDISKKEIEKIWEYWDVTESQIDLEENKAKEEVKSLLLDAVSLRQISDVSIGSTNSGGLDSSLVSAMMAKMHKDKIMTFTVKFPEQEFDETGFARLLSEHCNTAHQEIVVDTTNFFDLMKEYVGKKDEPIGIPNEIATYSLFKKIKKDATVILVGEGADEIFAGYGRIFRSPEDYEKIKKFNETNLDVYKNKYNSLYKKYEGKLFNSELEHFMFLYNYFPEKQKDSFLKKEYQKDFSSTFKNYFEKIKGDYRKKISYIFIKLHLPVILAKLDNSAMASAVEIRCPFLDYRLINLAFNLPFDLKNPWKSDEKKEKAETKNSDEISEEDDIPKYILKKVAENYIPREIIERKKKGFPVPLQKWFNGELFEKSKEILLSENSKIKKIVDIENLRKWIENGQKEEDKNFGQRLWMLVSLELWLREWF